MLGESSVRAFGEYSERYSGLQKEKQKVSLEKPTQMHGLH